MARAVRDFKQDVASGDERELGVDGLVAELERARELPLDDSVAAAVAGAGG